MDDGRSMTPGPTLIEPGEEPQAIRLPVPRPGPLIATAAIIALVVCAASWWLTVAMWSSGSPLNTAFKVVLTVISGLGSILVLRPLAQSMAAARSTSSLDTAEGRSMARAQASASRQCAAVSLGLSAGFLIVTMLVVFLVVNDAMIQKTFLQPHLMKLSLKETLLAFRQNVLIAIITQVLVLVLGLLLAMLRMASSDAARPVRVLATIYIDVFRGLPAIIVVYLVGFGLPLTGLPWISNFSTMWYAIIALTLTYSAYIAEVYRSGLESIHPSQVAAARSLGFSYLQSMRVVVVPQGVRRVIPPLLNNFISLQKDTAVVGIIGSIEAFTQSKIYAGNHFNVSSVTVVAIIFVVITIPQARLLDHLLDRQARKRARG